MAPQLFSSVPTSWPVYVHQFPTTRGMKPVPVTKREPQGLNDNTWIRDNMYFDLVAGKSACRCRDLFLGHDRCLSLIRQVILVNKSPCFADRHR